MTTENTTTLLESLKNRDYVLVLDKSGSMTEKDCPGGHSRWDSAKESTMAIANRIAEYEPEGFTVVPFAGHFKTYTGVTPSKVADIFKENEPMGGTTLGPVLNAVFASYTERKKMGKTKPGGEILLVITDGEPEDENSVAAEIVKFGNTLMNGRQEYGISLLQVGRCEHARNFLKKLDDDLVKQGAKYDIVNTKTMDELETVGLTEALIASLTE